MVLPVILISADVLVVKTRLQLSARRTNKTATASSSALPGPIASSAASLAGTAGTVKPPPLNPLNAVGTAVSIIKQEGIRGLYRGMSASYLGVSEGVIQWVLYEVGHSNFPFSTFANRPAFETSGPERRRRVNEPILPPIIYRIHSRRIRKCQSSGIPHNLPPRSHSHTTTSTYGERNPEIYWLDADSQVGRCRGRCQGVVWRIDTAYVEGGAQCGLYVLDLRGGRFQAGLR